MESLKNLKAAVSWYSKKLKLALGALWKSLRMVWSYREAVKSMTEGRRQEVLEDEEDVKGLIIIVTGSNAGIGKETAKELARRGATVIMACRDPLKAENARKDILDQVPESQLVVMRLDLGDLDSVRDFVAAFTRRYTRLDILINNAAICSPSPTYTKHGFESNMGVNYLGHFLLTLLLLDSLLRADRRGGRIVFVSSFAALTLADLHPDDLMRKTRERPVVAGTLYANSKLAIAIFSKQLSQLLRGTNISTYAVCPGVVAQTNLQNEQPLVKRFVRSAWNPVKALSVEQGTANVLYCALSKSLCGESGKFYRFLHVWEDPDRAMRSHSIENRFWELSEDAVGLTGFAQLFKTRLATSP